MQPHIEEIVLAQTLNPQCEEAQTRYFLGAVSTGRFLLITTHSPIDPAQPMDLFQSRFGETIYARSAETDFFKTSDMPIIATRPRSQRDPLNLVKALEPQQNLLHGLLAIGMGLVKPGSVRWEGDRFTAEYAEAPHATFGVKITTADGRDAPESVKAKVLADLEAGYKGRQVKPPLVRCEHKIQTPEQAEAERIANAPAPGSIEARIIALFEAREQERRRKGIQGRLARDQQGRVAEIHFESEPNRRVYLEYLPSAQLPPPFPHRIRTFIGSAQAQPGVPHQEITISSVRISTQPLEDAAFDPCPRLKPGSFFHGVLRADGGTHVTDPTEQRMLNRLVRERYSGSRTQRQPGV